jgi:hypothetical protein
VLVLRGDGECGVKVEAVEFHVQRPARIDPRGIGIGTDPLEPRAFATAERLSARDRAGVASCLFGRRWRNRSWDRRRGGGLVRSSSGAKFAMRSRLTDIYAANSSSVMRRDACSTENECKHLLWRTCRRAGMHIIGWRALRHTFASHLVMRGAPATLASILCERALRKQRRLRGAWNRRISTASSTASCASRVMTGDFGGGGGNRTRVRK